VKNAWILLPIALFFTAELAHAQRAQDYAMRCRDTGKNSKQCEVKNTGTNDMEVCMDIVKVCSDGDHVADFCSGQLSPGQIDSKVVKNFVPKVRLLVACQGTEFRNQEYQRLR